jgi:hypothetical protein
LTSVDALNDLLRGEVAAVEAYRRVLDRLGNSPTRGPLQDCRWSHAQRIAKLREQVMSLGGAPARDSAPWAAFARLFEGAVSGERDAVAALAEGEDQGVQLYQDALDGLDGPSRKLVETELLPAQEWTYRVMSAIPKTLY